MLLFVEAPGLSAPVTPGGQGQQPSLPSHETQALPVSQDVRRMEAESLQRGGKMLGKTPRLALGDPSAADPARGTTQLGQPPPPGASSVQ